MILHGFAWRSSKNTFLRPQNINNIKMPKKSKKYYGVVGYPNRKYKTLPKKRIINCSTDQCNFKPQDINSLIELLKEIE